MPGLTGLELQRHMADMRRKVSVIFVSGHGDIPTTVLAMQSGAENFLTKPVDTDVLLGAVERAIARDRADRGKHDQLELLRSRVDALTPAERKVFDLVVRGRLNKQIAGELGIAERTVKWHRHNLMQRLQIQSVAELVSIAERLGLVGTDDRPPGDPRLSRPARLKLRAAARPRHLSFGAAPHQRTVSARTKPAIPLRQPIAERVPMRLSTQTG